MVSLSRLVRDRTGAAGVEFALVLPLLLLLLLGIIDAGRFMWEVNEAQKAAQMGARFAVVTDPVASGISTASFVGVDGLSQGDRIPSGELGTITCTGASVSCSGTGCPAGMDCSTANSTAFTNIVNRMKLFYPAIGNANVTVLYSGSGIGYAGDPNGAQLQPLVTVQLKGLKFTPITFLLFKTINMPSFSTTLTAESLSGSQSN
jgi:Flp pilus assembly protein TadG